MIKQILSDYLQARKDRDLVAINLLSVVIGDVETKTKHRMVEKESATDEEVTAVVNKILKGIKMVLATEGITKEAAGLALTEQGLLMSYLPEMLEEVEIASIIEVQPAFDSIADAVKYFKKNYPGQVDMKIVTRLVNKKLTSS